MQTLVVLIAYLQSTRLTYDTRANVTIKVAWASAPHYENLSPPIIHLSRLMITTECYVQTSHISYGLHAVIFQTSQ